MVGKYYTAAGTCMIIKLFAGTFATSSRAYIFVKDSIMKTCLCLTISVAKYALRGWRRMSNSVEFIHGYS